MTEVFTNEEEDLLWTSGALSTDTPLGLLRAVFFLNGKNFCLRGGEEHRNLRISQLERVRDPPRYIYTEHASKNRCGGFAQLRVENKVVPIDVVPEVGNCCHVYVLDLYPGNYPQKHLKVIISILSHVPKFPRIPKLHGIPTIRLGKIHLLRICVVRPMSRDKRLIIVSEPQVLQLYTKQVYQRKLFKNEQATCHLLGYVTTKGLTLNSKKPFQKF